MNAPATTQRPDIPLPSQPGRSDRVGQGTAIEQTRAAAEVYAAVMVARERPRSTQQAIRWMEDACRIPALADKAFFRFPRSGTTVTGPSVHLARELARCWGNIQYGINELRRDDGYGQSEMQAFAWDLETNTRESIIFINPHMRDKKGGPEALTDLRDIYESNANNGARRVREAIFAVLPSWFVDQAKDICTETINHGGGMPLEQRIAKVVAFFANTYGVSEGRLVAKVGKSTDQWTALDLSPLTVIRESLKRGEVTVADEFPQEDRGTAAASDLVGERPTGQAPRARGARPGQQAPEGSDPAPAAPQGDPGPPEPPPEPEQPAAPRGTGNRRGGQQRQGQQQTRPEPSAEADADGASDGPRTDRGGYASSGPQDPAHDPWATGQQGTLGDQQ